MAIVIRDARPSDAPFLAECILAGMHLYDFEEIVNDDLADALENITQSALVADAEMPHLINLYSSIGFIPADHRNVFGTDFLRMIYTVKPLQPGCEEQAVPLCLR